MNLYFNIEKAEGYTSNSQIARVLTENWVKNNGYCPNCGEDYLSEFENNRKVADFYCKSCSEQFELKSKKGIEVGNKIVDGAYSSMIDRINSDENPNFFFLTYDKSNGRVNNFLVVPKYYFTPNIIEKRKPLPETARRSGWIGCNINLAHIPNNGRIFFVKYSKVLSKQKVRSAWNKTGFLKTKKGESKGWILDVMKCIDTIQNDVFSLKEIYSFESYLREKYPN